MQALYLGCGSFTCKAFLADADLVETLSRQTLSELRHPPMVIAI